MKVKNLKTGLLVQVKAKNHVGFFGSSAGKFGTITDIDYGEFLDVRVRYDDGVSELGNHAGIKRVKTSLQDVKVGDRVEILNKRLTAFFDSNKGRIGTVTLLDPDSSLDVKVEFDDGGNDWGNHSDIRILPKVAGVVVGAIEVGSRVRLKRDHVLGFQEGDVGTVKDLDGDGDAVVHFDVARNGWADKGYRIPDLHGLFVDPEDLELIID